jgi:hypothetical protein
LLKLKRLAGKTKRWYLPVALSPDGAGSAALALVRAGRIVARAGVSFSRAGTVGLRMRLPRRLKAGAYVLKITFTPAGASNGTTKSLPLRVRVPVRAPARARAAATGRRLSGGAPYGVAKTRPTQPIILG